MKELLRPDETFGAVIPAQTSRPGISYVQSQFVLPFSHRGKKYVFNTLTKQCIEATLPLRAEAGAGYDELIKARFLVPEGTDEFAFWRSVLALLKLNYRKKRKPAYTILPTLGCNARCVYCFQQGMQPIGMNAETVEDTLRFILNDCRGEKTTLSWFGGEPLLREDVIDRICRGVRDAGVPYKSLMVSNGSLITPEMIEKMTELWRLERIQISMDGAEQDYIARKRFGRYSDDYRTVIDAVARMSEAGIATEIRCNVDEANLERIPEYMDDLSKGILNKTNVTIQFTPLFQTLMRNDGHLIWPKILALRAVIARAGFECSFTYFNNALPTIHCMVDAGGVVITPNGDLHCCENLPNGSCIGNVRDGVTDPQVRIRFTDMDRIPAQCRTCIYLPDCMPMVDCPKNGLICVEGRRLLTLDALGQIIDEAEDRNP